MQHQEIPAPDLPNWKWDRLLLLKFSLVAVPVEAGIFMTPRRKILVPMIELFFLPSLQSCIWDFTTNLEIILNPSSVELGILLTLKTLLEDQSHYLSLPISLKNTPMLTRYVLEPKTVSLVTRILQLPTPTETLDSCKLIWEGSL